MRKTIRRGIFVTATAACALGFGLFQASAATVPAFPGVPELPLTSLSNLGQGVAVAPTMPTLPGVPGEDSRSLPTDGIPAAGLVSSLTSLLGGLGAPQRADLPGSDLAPEFSDLTSLLSLSETTQGLGAPELGDVTGVTEFADLPETGSVAPELPAGDLGLPAATPGDLPVGLDTDQLPALPQVPSETNEITKAPVVDLPETDRLPVVAQVDHNDIAQKLVPNTDGVDVQGLPKPKVPNVASTPNAVKLPATAPHTPGMQSVGVPQQLPVLSGIDAPEAPSIHDVTGDLDLPAELPQLPKV
ncbi:hypothetical protein JOF56_002266 [Kibdelosporangium banguiense]|uniref:GLTT repeat-containing protein n=1 Tax=Kibdelosporangium banguiense TaxID=1365924 RepID=A0ABS4TDH9_9PSEU|nr:hypothetical protein [Kibdelosporangium banguiense]MBP2321881.1 hypothetical protein [Kibdelosporangium banguiense]